MPFLLGGERGILQGVFTDVQGGGKGLQKTESSLGYPAGVHKEYGVEIEPFRSLNVKTGAIRMWQMRVLQYPGSPIFP